MYKVIENNLSGISPIVRNCILQYVVGLQRRQISIPYQLIYDV